jgi:hypothetical protein
MDLECHAERRAIHRPIVAIVILLDTNALIWLEQGHPRARQLTRLTL